MKALWPLPGGQPARSTPIARPANQRPNHHLPRASRSFVGYVSVPQAGGDVAFRSGIESDFLGHVALAGQITRIERNDLTDEEKLLFDGPKPTAPNRIFVTEYGEYTPDFRMWLNGALVYVEVGTAKEKYGPDLYPKLQAARHEAEDDGAGFLIVTERELRRGHLQPNGSKLYGYLDTLGADPALVSHARSIFEDAPRRLNVMEVAEQVCLRAGRMLSQEQLDLAIWSAVADARRRGALLLDLESTLLTPATPLAFGIAGDLPIPSIFEEFLEAQREETVQEDPTDEPEPIVDIGASLLTPEQKAEYDRRLAVVLDRQEHPRDNWESIGLRHDMSERMARHYWTRYEAEGRPGLEPLRDAPGVRLDPKVRKVISRLHRADHEWDASQISEHDEIERLRASGTPISYKQVQRYIFTELKTSKAAREKRMGRKVRSITPYQGPLTWTQKPIRPMQLVEIDEATANVFLLTSLGSDVIARPYILYAVDVATGMIVGWLICVKKPSQQDYLKLLRRVILPKDDLVASCGAEHEYPCSGIPEIIRTDRGLIFTARRPSRLLRARNCKVWVSAPYEPTLKPNVERKVRSVDAKIVAMMPGRAKLSPESGRDAIEEARRIGLTFDLFERVFAKAIIDKLHLDVLSAKNYAPLRRWNALSKQHGAPRPWPQDEAGLRELDLFTLVEPSGKPTRALDSRGYSVFGEWYTPEATGAPETAIILCDPEDVRYVQVLDTNGVYHCRATARNLDLRMALTYDELLEIKAGMRAENTNDTATIAEIVQKVRDEEPLKLREASKLERVIHAVREHPIEEEPVSTTEQEAPACDQAMELELDAPGQVSA